MLNLNKIMIRKIHHDHKPNKQAHGNTHDGLVQEIWQWGCGKWPVQGFSPWPATFFFHLWNLPTKSFWTVDIFSIFLLHHRSMVCRMPKTSWQYFQSLILHFSPPHHPFHPFVFCTVDLYHIYFQPSIRGLQKTQNIFKILSFPLSNVQIYLYL